MTVPTHADLQSVINEFGPFGPLPAASDLRSYVKGGSYVGTGPGTGPIGSCVNALALSSFNSTYGGLSSPVVNLYTASSLCTPVSGTVSIPPNSKQVTIEIWGGGGGGTSASSGCKGRYGGGGGSGGYARSVVTFPTPISSHWGQTMSYTAGAGGYLGCAGICGPGAKAGGTSTVSAGTYSSPLTTLTGHGGCGGGKGSSGGAGGSASGGTVVNTTGNSGTPGTNTSGGCGGAAITGLCSAAYGGGGHGDSLTNSGSTGAVKFTWS